MGVFQEKFGLENFPEEQIERIIGYRMSEAYKITDMTNLALQVSISGGRYER